jgi:hypothetical protein
MSLKWKLTNLRFINICWLGFCEWAVTTKNKLQPYPTSNFLGYVNDTINWKGCIEHATKFSAACYIMRSVKPWLSLNTLKIVYYTYFNSVIHDYLPFWVNSAHSIHIFRMQNNVVRILLGNKRRVSCRNQFVKLKILLSVC